MSHYGKNRESLSLSYTGVQCEDLYNGENHVFDILISEYIIMTAEMSV